MVENEVIAADIVETNTFSIPTCNMGEFAARIVKLSAKIVKLGFAPIVPVIGETTIQKRSHEGRWIKVEVVSVTIDYPKVKLAGWTFLASIEHSNDGASNVIRTVPNALAILPVKFRTADCVCDHCNIQRRRNNTFVLVSDDGATFKQIGRSCLKDFIGHDPKKIAALLQYLFEASDSACEFQEGGGGSQVFALNKYLEHAAAVVRVHGWVSAKVASEYEHLLSSRSRIWSNLNPPTSGETIAITDEDRQMAADARAWALSLSDKISLSDYEHNITTIAAKDYINYRATGMAASIVGSHFRNTTERLERASKVQSAHIGKTGERLRDLKAKVIGHSTRDTDFGTTHIYRFVTADGNKITWFSSKNAMIDIDYDVILTGTVKAHEVWKDCASTTLTRCAVVKA